MMDDTITTLLRGVADGSIPVADARTALEGAELTEDEMASAIDHGVFNIAEPGTIVSASLAPSGASYLTMFFLAWGLFWICYWSFSMIYGLAKGWGPTAIVVPPRHDDDNRDHDWHHLPEVHLARHHHRQARSKQIHSRARQRLAGVQVVMHHGT